MAANLNQFEDKMKKSLSVLEADLASIRAGRANPAILDNTLLCASIFSASALYATLDK